MAWEVALRFDYGAIGTEPVRLAGVPGFVHRGDVLAVETFGAGEPEAADRAVRGAMLRLGYRDQVHMSLAWMFGAVRRTLPRLRPMYRLDGSPALPARELPLDGYRGSRPVVAGNPAQGQLQLGDFGDVLDMTRAYVRGGGAVAPRTAVELPGVADHLCRIWRRPDAGIWELPDRGQYTQGKLASWLALTHAAELAELGALRGHRAGAWRRQTGAIERWLREDCRSERRRSHARAAGSDELDAAVLLAARGSFLEDDKLRLNATIDAIRRELGAGGPLVYRYSGMEDREGAFLACSFWVAEALARAGRLDEAAEAIDALVAMASDVGLYAEEIDPATGELLGNVPQALTHLALVNAASAVSESAG